jgi:phosphoribosylformimino-5-aminoimidazole carboxamide ribotide isomerase
LNVVSAEWPLENLVGVLDLFEGKAVHAIAGERAKYRSVGVCDGDPVLLVRHYCRLGVRSFYIADLDSICGQPVQEVLLHELASEIDGDLLVDTGWSGAESESAIDGICRLVNSHASFGLIAATETARSPLMLDRLLEHVAAERVWLGLDFGGGDLLVSPHLREHGFSRDSRVGAALNVMMRDGEIVGDRTHREFCVDCSLWLDHATSLGMNGVVVLDIAAVGQKCGPVTGRMCSDIKKSHPDLTIWSGGGIRDASDAMQLVQQGCDRCLVATALQGHP